MIFESKTAPRFGAMSLVRSLLLCLLAVLTLACGSEFDDDKKKDQSSAAKVAPVNPPSDNPADQGEDEDAQDVEKPKQKRPTPPPQDATDADNKDDDDTSLLDLVQAFLSGNPGEFFGKLLSGGGLQKIIQAFMSGGLQGLLSPELLNTLGDLLGIDGEQGQAPKKPISKKSSSK